MSSYKSSNPITVGPRTKQALIIAGGVLLLLVSALLIYNVLITPTKQPYRDALSQYKNVYNANVAFSQTGANLNASGATEEQFGKNIEVSENALKALEVEVEALGKEEVLQTGTGKELYDAFKEKLTAYVEYNEGVLASIREVRPVIYNCSQLMSSVPESATGVLEMQNCATSVGEAAKVEDQDYKALAQAFSKSYGEFAVNLQKVTKLKDPKGADKTEYNSLLDEREMILESMNTASGAFAKSLQAHRAEVDITETAKALDDYLSKKSSIF